MFVPVLAWMTSVGLTATITMTSIVVVTIVGMVAIVMIAIMVMGTVVAVVTWLVATVAGMVKAVLEGESTDAAMGEIDRALGNVWGL
jgi:hypothetical protein